MYKSNKLPNDDDNYNDDNNKKYFPSKSFRNNDSRVPILNKEKMDKPMNMGMFVPDSPNEAYYDVVTGGDDFMMDSRDFKTPIDYDKLGSYEPEQCNKNKNKNKSKTKKRRTVTKSIPTGFDMNDTRFDPRTDFRMDPGPEKFDKRISQYRISPDPDPRNKYILSNLSKKIPENYSSENQHQKFIGHNSDGLSKDLHNFYDMANKSSNMDRCYSEYDSNYCNYNGKMKQKNNRILTDDGYLDNRYGKFDRPNFSEKSDMDMKSKMVIPKLSSKDKKNLNTYNYTMQSVIDNGLSKPMKNYEFVAL